MAEELVEKDLPSSSENEEKENAGSLENSEKAEDSPVSERSGDKKGDSVPQPSPDGKNETIPTEKGSKEGSVSDPQNPVAESTESTCLITNPEKSSRSKIFKPIEVIKEKIATSRLLGVHSEDPCSLDAPGTDRSPLSPVGDPETSLASTAAGSSQGDSKKGDGSFAGRAISDCKEALKDCKKMFKDLFSKNKLQSKESERISIVVSEEGSMETETYHPTFEVPAPPINRADLETLDVVPQIYDESPDITETTTVEDTDSENKKKESTDAEARRSGLSSQEVSSFEESSKRESSDVGADVSSEDREYEAHLKPVKRTPLKRQRKTQEDDSSDSDSGAASGGRGLKRAQHTTRL